MNREDSYRNERDLKSIASCHVKIPGGPFYYILISLLLVIGAVHVLEAMVSTFFSLLLPGYNFPGRNSHLMAGLELILFIFAFLVGLLVYRYRYDRLYFTLTEYNIVQGYFFLKKIPLRSITRIVTGLPVYSKKAKFKFINRVLSYYTSPFFLHLKASREKSLLLKLYDGSSIPLNFTKLAGGEIFQEALIKRLRVFVDPNYRFDEAERTFFAMNRMIKNGKRIRIKSREHEIALFLAL